MVGGGASRVTPPLCYITYKHFFTSMVSTIETESGPESPTKAPLLSLEIFLLELMD